MSDSQLQGVDKASHVKFSAWFGACSEHSGMFAGVVRREGWPHQLRGSAPAEKRTADRLW